MFAPLLHQAPHGIALESEHALRAAASTVRRSHATSVRVVLAVTPDELAEFTQVAHRVASEAHLQATVRPSDPGSGAYSVKFSITRT